MATVKARDGRTRGAGVLFLLGLSAVAALLAARPAAALGDTRPDLQISVAPRTSWATADGGQFEDFAVTVRNTGEFEPESRQWFGGPASGVVAKYTIPQAKTVQAVSAPAASKFACSWADRVVTCTGGSLPRTGSAVITVVTKNILPWSDVTSFCVEQHAAVVDPASAIAERDETNNTFSATVFLSLIHI